MTAIIQINQYQYPIGWEWLHNVHLEDWQWLIDVFATMTDDMTIYDYAEDITYIHNQLTNKIYIINNHVDTQKLAKFLNDDQGYEGGIREYGHYIAAKTLGIKSEDEYLDKFNKIREICNESQI